MISLKEYNPFFMKKNYDIQNYKPKYKKRTIIYDELFYIIFNKAHNHDITHMDYSKINEKQEKTKLAVCIEKIKLKPKEKEKIIENLLYEKKINFKTFHSLCLYYKINVLYVKDNIFINMNYGDEKIYMENNRIVDPIDISAKYEVNLDKPLRCASYYKIDDLRQISTQLHLPIENIKKQQLYDSIHNVLTKLNI